VEYASRRLCDGIVVDGGRMRRVDLEFQYCEYDCVLSVTETEDRPRRETQGQVHMQEVQSTKNPWTPEDCFQHKDTGLFADYTAECLG
jgi:hypothetical protein